MATSSIYKDINAKDKASIMKLVKALEKSSASKPHDVVMSRPVSDMSKEEIRKLFGGSDEGI